MRSQLIEALTAEAESDRRIVLLTADLGYGVVDSFAKRHPDRFINVGVTEQAMISIATGLAKTGLIPYCYSIATFASLRALEFIRNGPVAHGLPVRIIGIGPGFDYENDGITHYAVDDLAALRSQPGLSIWAPADELDFTRDFLVAHNAAGPVYLRIPRHPVTPVPGVSRVTRGVESRSKCLLLSFGDARIEANEVRQSMLRAGVESDYAESFWISGQSREEIAKLLSDYEVCVTVETHYEAGGFGSWVLEIAQMLTSPPRIVVHGVSSLPVGPLGSRSWLARTYMTDPATTTQRVVTITNHRS